MSQNLVYDVLVLDTRNDLGRPAAPTTNLDIDVEDALKTLSPGHRGVTFTCGA
jgi:hypothetical protein